jgi:hypothetical protein
MSVRCAHREFGRDNDPVLGIDRRLAVVALLEGTIAMLHDPAVRVSKVLLRLILGYAEVALVARATFWRAVRLTRPPIVIIATSFLPVSLTLALLQSRLGRRDRCQTLLAPGNFFRYVQLRLVALGFVCRLPSALAPSTHRSAP